MATAISAIRNIPSGLDGFGNAVVLGDGLLSVYIAMLLKSRLNFSNVHIFGNSRYFRSNLLSRFGFIPNYKPDQRPAYLNGTIDVVIEAAGSTNALNSAYALLRPGGTLVLVGLVLPGSVLPFSAEQIIRKNLTIRGVHNYNRIDLQDGIEFLADNVNKYPTSELVGTIFNMDQYDEAFKAANSKKYFRVFIKP